MLTNLCVERVLVLFIITDNTTGRQT